MPGTDRVCTQVSGGGSSACFSPDGRTLSVNIQGDPEAGGEPGRTFAIRGPWEKEAL